MVNPPTPPISNADRAIAAIKSKFSEVAKIQKKATGTIGASTGSTTIERADGWDLVFWQGSGDCPSGCIDNHYYYFSAKIDGSVTMVGEYVRVFDSDKNAYDTTGAPMWGVPK